VTDSQQEFNNTGSEVGNVLSNIIVQPWLHSSDDNFLTFTCHVVLSKSFCNVSAVVHSSDDNFLTFTCHVVLSKSFCNVIAVAFFLCLFLSKARNERLALFCPIQHSAAAIAGNWLQLVWVQVLVPFAQHASLTTVLTKRFL